MTENDFNTKLLATRTVFNSELIKPGNLLHLYKIYAKSPSGAPLTFVATGIVVEADALMIKYAYFSVSRGEMQNGYLLASDMYQPEGPTEQWEGREVLYLFKLKEGPDDTI